MTGANVTRLVMLCALMLSLMLSAEYLLFHGFEPWAIDFRVFWRSAFKQASELYVSSNAPFVYPPTAIVFFRPLAILTYPTGYLVWTGLSVGLFALAVMKLTGWRVALLSLLSAGSLQGLALGQTPMILSAALLYAITLPGFACGLIFGIVVSIKPQLLLLAPLAFLVRKDWRTIAGMAVGLLGCVTAELALYGVQPWLDWFNAIPAFREALIEIRAAEQVITPYGIADHLGFSPVPFLALSTALAVAAIVVSAKHVEGIYLVAAIVGASILASPYALRHDTIALVPASVAFILAHPKLKALPAVGIFSGCLVGASLLAVVMHRIFARMKAPPEAPTQHDQAVSSAGSQTG